MKNSSIEIYIDKLVLHGFAASDQYSIGSAIQEELSRLFTERGVPSSFQRGGNIEVLNGGQFQRSGSREITGAHIAGLVYESLSNTVQKPANNTQPVKAS